MDASLRVEWRELVASDNYGLPERSHDPGEIAIGAITRGEAKRGARWIKPNPHKAGPADAWVLPQRVSVWALIRQLQLDSWKAELVAEGFELPLEAVEATIRYYRRHRANVDARLERNRLFFGS